MKLRWQCPAGVVDRDVPSHLRQRSDERCPSAPASLSPMDRRIVPLCPVLRRPVIANRASANGPRRSFHGTRASRASHYETLSIPRNASRSQIKSAYYKLSKQYHPDINKDPQAREKFHTFSEAYTILGDDRKRRAYDRSLGSEGITSNAHQPGHPADYHSQYTSANEARRRMATYAWERRHRPPPGSHPHVHPTAHRPQAMGDTHNRPTASAGPHRPPRTGWKETELDRVNSVSSLGRAAQLVGLFVIVAFVGTLGGR
ncbi:DnaJ domain-containing protein [Gloeopeniophorella convolvens]|nr:DnaJ domain-containing protein [Gloeopeniophorella convolvens]